MNRFRIDDSLSIDSVGFAFVGEIIEGSAAAGMTFKLREADHWWTMKVKSLEFVRLAGGKEKVGLVVEDDRYIRGFGAGWTAEFLPSRETE
jgi:hypothetical protein